MHTHQLLDGPGLVQGRHVDPVDIGDERRLQHVSGSSSQIIVDIDSQLSQPRCTGGPEPAVPVDDYVLGRPDLLLLVRMSTEKGGTPCDSDRLDLPPDTKRLRSLLDVGVLVAGIERVVRQLRQRH